MATCRRREASASRFADGEIFGLLGPNGSGKTTTLECIIGLREPDAGAIEVCGIDARRHPQGREAEDRRGASNDGAAGQDHAARSADAVRVLLSPAVGG